MINVLNRGASVRPGDVHFYTLCEHLTCPLIYFMVIFTPWAYGTTQEWSEWTMNAVGYLLGALLAAKLFIRYVKGYHAPRWDSHHHEELDSPGHAWICIRHLNAILVGLTFAILAFCLVSAINAAATHDLQALTFLYHKFVRWLPHSFDSTRTWRAFWNYLALACAFWAIKDWLGGKSQGEQRAARQKPVAQAGTAPPFPARLRGLLWILCINGALVGVEGIVQRLEGSGRLLFFIKPHINPDALSQFGPYHYRGNAAAYFNLLWPICLGFWWTLQRMSSARRKSHHVLLFCALIMAACPIISSSRGGALVTLMIIVLAIFFFVATHFLLSARKQEDKTKRIITFALLLLFFAGTLTLGLSLGWKALKPRLAQIEEGFEGRETTYEFARPMAADYPVYGTGPGTFASVFQLYRISTDTYWPAQLHNDWLETRITFGWVGTILILMALLTVALRWFARGGLHGGRRFMIMMWLALGGCLTHARYDFPLQIYSILFLFLVFCAMAFNLSRRP